MTVASLLLQTYVSRCVSGRTYDFCEFTLADLCVPMSLTCPPRNPTFVLDNKLSTSQRQILLLSRPVPVTTTDVAPHLLR